MSEYFKWFHYSHLVTSNKRQWKWELEWDEEGMQEWLAFKWVSDDNTMTEKTLEEELQEWYDDIWSRNYMGEDIMNKQRQTVNIKFVKQKIRELLDLEKKGIREDSDEESEYKRKEGFIKDFWFCDAEIDIMKYLERGNKKD